MAHFAQLNQYNTVTAVIVVNDDILENRDFPESEPLGVAFCQQLYGSGTQWRQTSYSANFRKNYAGIHGTYDPVLDAFVPVKPFPSWTLNSDTCRWDPPVPQPSDAHDYRWDESSRAWVQT